MNYSIGDISRMFDIPVSTLRYYDSEGLFPLLQRKSGVRIFTETEIDQLNLIECLKKTGLEIREIRQFMEWAQEGPETYEQRRDLMYTQLENVEKQIAELKKAEALVRFKCWYYDKAVKDGNEKELDAMFPDHFPPEIQELFDLSHNRTEG